MQNKTSSYVNGHNAGRADVLDGIRLTTVQLSGYDADYRSGYARAQRDAHVILAAVAR